jgi:hypothetical protein
LDDFLRFVVERHRIWELRQAGAPMPWTDDPVLSTRKFTNVFRVLDPGTQFVLTDLFDEDTSERDLLMRLFLYRHTGRIETWQWLELCLGRYPLVSDLDDVLEAFKEYRGVAHVRTRTADPKNAGRKTQTDYVRSVFTNAYLVFPQSGVPGTDKLESIVDLTQRLFTPGSPQYVMDQWAAARTQQQRFKVLRQHKGVGDFMAMQILTDWGYFCSEDREDEFLVPGPGSIKGAAALDPNAKTLDVVHRVVKEVRGLADVPRLGYRVPSLMDIGSNLLCEWSKYVRFRGQPVPTTTYKPAHPGPQPAPVLPTYYTEESLI